MIWQGPAAPESEAHADISATSGSGVRGLSLGAEQSSPNKRPLQPSAKYEPPEAAAALAKGGTAARVTNKHGAFSGGGRFWEGHEQPLRGAGGGPGGGTGVAQLPAHAQDTSSAAASARAADRAGAAEGAHVADGPKRRRMEAASVQPPWAWEGGVGAGYAFPGPGGAYPAVRDWGPEQVPWDPSAGGRPRPYASPYSIPYGMPHDTPYGMPYGLLPGSAAGGAQSSGLRASTLWDGGQALPDRRHAGRYGRLPPLPAAPEWGGGPGWGGGPKWHGDPGWQDQWGFAPRGGGAAAADAGPWCAATLPLTHAICLPKLNISQEVAEHHADGACLPPVGMRPRCKTSASHSDV